MRLLSAFLLFCMICVNAHAKTCVMADDFGVTTELTVPALPTGMITVPGKSEQMAPWLDTQYYTSGVALSSNNLKVYVTGSWTPWSNSSLAGECQYFQCNGNEDSALYEGQCMPNGNGIVIKNDFNTPTSPCTISDAKGLYGLIAMQVSGSTANPNTTSNIVDLPTSNFRTFHLGYPPLLSDDDGKYFMLSATKWYNAATKTFVTDKNSLGNNYIVAGRLYFKIVDTHYGDNTGGYTLTIVQGVYNPNHNFISNIINYVNTTITKVSTGIYQSIVQDTGFIDMVQALLVLYVAITGVLYAMGAIQSQKQEMIIRLVKIAVISTLISPISWDFFNTYLFSIFINGGQQISAIVLSASATAANSSILASVPSGSNILVIFDQLLAMLFSKAIWNKIYTIFFSGITVCKASKIGAQYLFFSLIIIAAVLIMTISILKGVGIFIVTIFQIAILLVIAPIFIIMILFNQTKELFDKWIQQMMANTVLFILLSVAISLVTIIVFGQLEITLRFAACSSSDCWTLLPGWSPKNVETFKSAVSAHNVFLLFFLAIFFNAIMSELPMMVDDLANAPLRPISSAYSGFSGNLQRIGVGGYTVGYFTHTLPNQLNPLGYLADKAVPKGTRQTVSRLSTTVTRKHESDSIMHPSKDYVGEKTKF